MGKAGTGRAGEPRGGRRELWGNGHWESHGGRRELWGEPRGEDEVVEESFTLLSVVAKSGRDHMPLLRFAGFGSLSLTASSGGRKGGGV